MNNKLNMSEQCAAAAKKSIWVLGDINKDITSRDCHSQLFSSHAWNILFSFAHGTQNTWGQAEEKGSKDAQKTGKLLHKERQRELGLLSLEEKKV